MSIRLRVAIVFTLALAVAFALGSWLFVSQLATQLRNSTRAALAVELNAAAQYYGTSAPTGEYLLQILDASGHVRYASPDTGTDPLLTSGQRGQARSGTFFGPGTQDDDSIQLLARRFGGHRGWVVVAGIPLDAENSTVNTAVAGLVIGGVAFVLIGGAGAYWLARAALSPVERMRREVAALSERDTRASVRVPATRDEIAALAGTMNDLLSRLHAALARQRGFVADASHELRTPLAVLGAELELAGRPGRSHADLAQAIGNAAEEVSRLTRITNDLLVLARSDEDSLIIRPQPVDIAGLLDRCAEQAAARAAAAGVSCAVQAPAELRALVDPDRIRQAVDNLVDNALRFAPGGSQVMLRASATGPDAGDLVIEVIDAGPGFPAEFLPLAFERFRRPDTGRSRSDGGAGLGLAIVRAITAAHGGTVAVRNLPSSGAAVTLNLPGVVRTE